MNRRELLASVIGVAGCAALPAVDQANAVRDYLHTPVPLWAFSEVVSFGGNWETGDRHLGVRDANTRHYYQIEVDAKTYEAFCEWQDGEPKKRDVFFTNLTHMNRIMYEA